MYYVGYLLCEYDPLSFYHNSLILKTNILNLLKKKDCIKSMYDIFNKLKDKEVIMINLF
jgi:hypothetical protein